MKLRRKKLAEIGGKKGRIAGAIVSLLAVCFGVLFVFQSGIVSLLVGVLLVVGGIYEMKKVLFRSDYQLTITSGGPHRLDRE